jgi:hypothetical protein
MGISFPFVPRAAKNLVPGYRRRWQFSYAALLAKMSQAVPTMTFGETDGVPWLEPSPGGLRPHGFWTETKDAELFDDLRSDLPNGLPRPYFRLVRDFLIRD